MDELLVIKLKAMMKPEDQELFRERIEQQAKTGVVIVPYYCDVVRAPKDTAIVVKCEDLPVKYLCDKRIKGHRGCGHQCTHTGDITHAKNFELRGGAYWEKESE